jgi:transposase-like protein
VPKIRQYSAAEKLSILQELETNSNIAIAYKYDLHKSTITDWLRRYEVYGYKGLEIRTHNKIYSADLKIQAVQDYLSGNGSLRQIIEKYKITDKKQLRNWINKYNSHSSFKSNEGGGTYAMTKGRATTWQERIDTVLYCLAHNYDYLNTAKNFQVSYPQVYQWVKKYEEGGEDALKDGRGRKRTVEELSDTDRQKLAVKKLESENERLRAENALLKKLQELEGRRF